MSLGVYINYKWCVREQTKLHLLLLVRYAYRCSLGQTYLYLYTPNWCFSSESNLWSQESAWKLFVEEPTEEPQFLTHGNSSSVYIYIQIRLTIFMYTYVYSGSILPSFQRLA